MSDVIKQLETFLLKKPVLGRDAYIAEGAVIVGDVTIGDYSSVWYNAVLRGDINRIGVGHHTNIQDNAVLHRADEYPCIVGYYEHDRQCALFHACTDGEDVLVALWAAMRASAVS